MTRNEMSQSLTRFSASLERHELNNSMFWISPCSLQFSFNDVWSLQSLVSLRWRSARASKTLIKWLSFCSRGDLCYTVTQTNWKFAVLLLTEIPSTLSSNLQDKLDAAGGDPSSPLWCLTCKGHAGRLASGWDCLVTLLPETSAGSRSRNELPFPASHLPNTSHSHCNVQQWAKGMYWKFLGTCRPHIRTNKHVCVRQMSKWKVHAAKQFGQNFFKSLPSPF